MRAEGSPNHQFILSIIPRGRVLDFGCGNGHLVGVGRAAGHDFWGVDTFDGKWAHWHDRVLEDARPYVTRSEGPLPFADGHFDAVVSNQVFEHIPAGKVAECVGEIARVLKPGGMFLVLFPTKDTWFEGHLHLYFPHWMNGSPRLQRTYLRARYGMARIDDPAGEALRRHRYLHTAVFYHDAQEFCCLLSALLGAKPTSLEAENMRFRFGRSKMVKCLPNGVLRFIHLKRAGRVLLVRKQAP